MAAPVVIEDIVLAACEVWFQTQIGGTDHGKIGKMLSENFTPDQAKIALGKLKDKNYIAKLQVYRITI